MISDFLFIFMIVSLICFFLTIFMLMIDQTIFSFTIIMLGMIMSILCTYGLWNVEYRELGFNSTSGLTESITTSVNYGEPYSYLFFILFFLFVVFFLYAVFRSWQVMLEDEGVA